MEQQNKLSQGMDWIRYNRLGLAVAGMCVGVAMGGLSYNNEYEPAQVEPAMATIENECQKELPQVASGWLKSMKISTASAYSAYDWPLSGPVVEGWNKAGLEGFRVIDALDKLDARLPFPLKSSEISDIDNIYSNFYDNIDDWASSLVSSLQGLPISFIEYGFIKGVAFKPGLFDDDGKVIEFILDDEGILQVNASLGVIRADNGAKALWQGILREAGVSECDDPSLADLSTDFEYFRGFDSYGVSSKFLYRNDENDQAYEESIRMLMQGSSYDRAWGHYDLHTNFVLFGGESKADDQTYQSMVDRAKRVASIVYSIDPVLGEQLVGAIFNEFNDDAARHEQRESVWRRRASQRSLQEYLGLTTSAAGSNPLDVFPASRSIGGIDGLDLPSIDVPVGENLVANVRFDALNQRLLIPYNPGKVGQRGDIRETLQMTNTEEMYFKVAAGRVLGIDPVDIVMDSFGLGYSRGINANVYVVDAKGWGGFDVIVD